MKVDLFYSTAGEPLNITNRLEKHEVRQEMQELEGVQVNDPEDRGTALQQNAHIIRAIDELHENRRITLARSHA